MSGQEQATWNILAVLRWTTERFTKQGLDSPRLDAEILLAHCLNIDRVRLYTDFDKPMSKEELAAFRGLVRRRLRHEPVSYIRGTKEFFSLDFEVRAGVLVPRPDTELLVELCRDRIDQLVESGVEEPRLLDVGTGSGAIAIALAHERPAATIRAVDISSDALDLAQKNAASNEVEVEFIASDLLAGLARPVEADIVAANLPYIATAELDGLSPDVAEWEPRLALHGGSDGLDLVRRLVHEAKSMVTPGAFLAFEVGATQTEATAAIFGEVGALEISIHPDLAGLPRVVTGLLPKTES
jgi:release factor glutamine methyltransferase